MPKLEVKVINDRVEFFDPLNEQNNKTTISFQRTLRLPDDGKIYPLPPSLGPFPVCRVDDYLNKVPEEWKKHGGVFLPMYQREAMWLKFDVSHPNAPKAIKVAVGKVNAITGESWNNSLSKQDYIVAGNGLQPWLDGINGGNGMIKQFVAMPLGGGYTVEAQVTGEEKFGGIQLMVFESKVKPKQIHWKREENNMYSHNGNCFNFGGPPPPPSFNAPVAQFGASNESFSNQSWNFSATSAPPMGGGGFSFSSGDNIQYTPSLGSAPTLNAMPDSLADFLSNEEPVVQPDIICIRRRTSSTPQAKEMGISAGGKMKQKIVEDPFGVDHWDTECFGRCYVHIVNSAMYEQITGKAPPSTPISAKTYSSYGYEWYDVYEENVSGVKGSSILDNVKSVKEIDQEKFAFPQQDDNTVFISGNQVQQIHNKNSVRDGDW